MKESTGRNQSDKTPKYRWETAGKQSFPDYITLVTKINSYSYRELGLKQSLNSFGNRYLTFRNHFRVLYHFKLTPNLMFVIF